MTHNAYMYYYAQTLRFASVVCGAGYFAGAGSESRLWESGLGSGTDACGYPIL